MYLCDSLGCKVFCTNVYVPYIHTYNDSELLFAVTEVPATVHVPAVASDTMEVQAVELSAQPMAAPHRPDVYSTLKLDVTIDNIQLELYSGDSDLVCSC